MTTPYMEETVGVTFNWIDIRDSMCENCDKEYDEAQC